MKSEHVKVDANDLKDKTKGQDFVGDVKDVPRAYGPHKTLYNRFRRWTGRAYSTVFSAAWQCRTASDTLIRCDTSQSSQDGGELAEKGCLRAISGEPGADEHQAARRV